MKNKRAKALMVLGTASHVGKSITVAALCRILHQDGFSVAPFKAQNMSLNSFATREGHEIGRAQAVQAQAAGIDPHVDMNPILLKPSSDNGAQVVLNGKVFGQITAANFQELKPQLFESVVEAYERLAARYDFIILEGAGSPVEMNLKDDGDIVNLRMAEAADAACILVADIDRGGVFASLVGTYELLAPGERKRFGGFIINKFRGDVSLLRPGVDFLEARTRQSCLGIVPYFTELKVDEEDSVALDDARSIVAAHESSSAMRVCVIRLPHISNFSDFRALEAASNVSLFYARTPSEMRAVDVLILPGSKNTISDLCWLRASGLAEAVTKHASGGKALIGICGGFQMLGQEVLDPFHVEGEVDRVLGLGLLDVITSLDREKVTRQAQARLVHPEAIGATECDLMFEGYEIHMGETRLGPGARPFFSLTRLGDSASISDGAVSDDGRIIGTYLHGLFDSARGTAALLSHLRRVCGRPQSTEMTIVASREQHYDDLAAHFRRNLDVKAIYKLVGIDIGNDR